jgi:hypothetical protein
MNAPFSPFDPFQHRPAGAAASIEAVALKLRILAWNMRYTNGGSDGARPLSNDEKTITSALAAAERLALAHHRGEG